jgi:hypothetical protein
MKNVLKLFFLLFIAFFLVSCNGDDKPEKTITTLTLSTTKLELVEGETGQIEAVAKTDKDEAVAITYEVSDPTIASVNSSGKVTAIKEGSTTVTLTANDKTATCTITVTKEEVVEPPVVEPKVTFAVSEITIELDVNPEYTLTPKLVGEAELSYAIDHEDVLSIEGNKITALKVGNAVVTATYGESTATINVTVVKQFSVSLDQEINEGDEVSAYVNEPLSLVIVDKTDIGIGVECTSSDKTVATITNSGVITPLAEGTTTIKVQSITTLALVRTFQLVVGHKPLQSFSFSYPDNMETSGGPYDVNVELNPVSAKNDIRFELVEPTSILTLRPLNGQVIVNDKIGFAKIRAYSQSNPNIEAHAVIEINFSMVDLINYLNQPLTVAQNIMLIGWQTVNNPPHPVEPMYGSINKYLFDEHRVVYNWMKPGTVGYVEYETGSPNPVMFVTVHDVGGNAAGETAEAISNYCNSNAEVSYHYTVDDSEAWQNIEHGRAAWHAGCGQNLSGFSYLDTGIPYDITRARPAVDVSTDGYLTINGEKSLIKLPLAGNRQATKADFPSIGLMFFERNGNYYTTTLYWNTTYQTISNKGGNDLSVGIESCINKGGDLYQTWQRLAKLVANILYEHNLGLDAVSQHNNWSGKDCPGTMRRAGYWDHFMTLVEAELLVLKQLEGYEITLELVNDADKEYVNDRGRVLKLPATRRTINYNFKLRKDGVSYSFPQTSVILAASEIKPVI